MDFVKAMILDLLSSGLTAHNTWVQFNTPQGGSVMFTSVFSDDVTYMPYEAEEVIVKGDHFYVIED